MSGSKRAHEMQVSPYGAEEVMSLFADRGLRKAIGDEEGEGGGWPTSCGAGP